VAARALASTPVKSMVATTGERNSGSTNGTAYADSSAQA
jgi:hypothetical protein